MRTPPLILIADDEPLNLEMYRDDLARQGYQVVTATDGDAALALAREHRPDLALLDLVMPGLDGLEVCRHLKADPALPFIPLIIATASLTEMRDVVAGLEAGADEYLTKPVDRGALVARVRSMLRIKALHDTVQEQAARLVEWNRTLEQRVAEQVAALERLGRLKRFLSRPIAELIVSSGDLAFLDSHRREIAVVFCDLRNFTAFSEAAGPDEVMAVLREYHTAVCSVMTEFGATVEHFAGDGIMAFFNDPLPCPDPAARAVRMAVAMRAAIQAKMERWRQRGHHLALGIGIAWGEATMGEVGFEGLYHYAAIGSVANLGARLCAEARGGQILVSQEVYEAVVSLVDAEPMGALALKGFPRPVPAYSILGLHA